MPYVRRASHRLEGNHEPILHTSSAAGGAVRPAGGAAGCGDCLFCIAFSALDAVQTQRAAVSGQYKTVGIPKLDIDWRKVLFTRDGGFTALSQQDTTYPGLITEDRRVFMTAHVPGSQAVSAYERGFFSEPAAAYDAYAKSLSVLAVRCTAFSEACYEANRSIIDEATNEIISTTYQQRMYYSTFTLESVISQFPAYEDAFPPITDLTISCSLYPNDGKIPFEEGKTYLVFGCAIFGNREIVGYDENEEVIYDLMSPGH